MSRCEQKEAISTKDVCNKTIDNFKTRKSMNFIGVINNIGGKSIHIWRKSLIFVIIFLFLFNVVLIPLYTAQETTVSTINTTHDKGTHFPTTTSNIEVDGPHLIASSSIQSGKPGIARCKNDDLIVTYFTGNDTHYYIEVYRSEDYGVTWEYDTRFREVEKPSPFWDGVWNLQACPNGDLIFVQARTKEPDTDGIEIWRTRKNATTPWIWDTSLNASTGFSWITPPGGFDTPEGKRYCYYPEGLFTQTLNNKPCLFFVVMMYAWNSTVLVSYNNGHSWSVWSDSVIDPANPGDLHGANEGDIVDLFENRSYYVGWRNDDPAKPYKAQKSYDDGVSWNDVKRLPDDAICPNFCWIDDSVLLLRSTERRLHDESINIYSSINHGDTWVKEFSYGWELARTYGNIVSLPSRGDSVGGWAYAVCSGTDHRECVGFRIYNNVSMNWTWPPGPDEDGGEWLIVPDANTAPSIPEMPSGPTSGVEDIMYSFSTSSDDPEDHMISYVWDWGDGTEQWIGPFESGMNMTASHSWKRGNYSIRVKAVDLYGAKSNWSGIHMIQIVDPIISIDPIKGGFSVQTAVVNTGEIAVDELSWTIDIFGGILGRIDVSTSGNIPELLPGESYLIESDLILGLGVIDVDVSIKSANVEIASKNTNGYVLLFYSFIEE